MNCQAYDFAQIEVSPGWSMRQSRVIGDAVDVGREPIDAPPAQSLSLISAVLDGPVCLADRRIHVVQPYLVTAREVGTVVGVIREASAPRADRLEIE